MCFFVLYKYLLAVSELVTRAHGCCCWVLFRSSKEERSRKKVLDRTSSMVH